MLLNPNALPRYCRVTLGVIHKSSILMKRKLSNSADPRIPKRTRMTTAKITLTQRESQLRNLLLDVARYIDESKEIKEAIELRFAGGWVRDKLLDIPSHDIDTAINAMTGLSFGIKMREYLADAQNLKKHNLQAEDIRNLYTIAANPEKSKHLETATTNIFDFDVDFVNLRKETYSEGNRNPQVEFGTPKEDAERRDATINAMFYNLHSNQVEDFEGGLDDLAAKRIRTPLEPKQTFKDDPLRVLRLIRFASRLDFRIDSESEKYMGDAEIMKALETMISRERIGIEVEKMLKGNDPQSSLQYFDRLGLYSTVFTDPSRDVPSPSTEKWSISYGCLSDLIANETPGSICQIIIRSDDARYLAWILAALTPWSSMGYAPARKPGGKADPSGTEVAREGNPFGTEVAREGIRLDNKGCAVVTGAFRNRIEITAAKSAVAKGEAWTSERDTLGMKIRHWGSNWKLHALFALLVEAASTEQKALFEGWQGFLDQIEKMELMDVANEKYPLTGTVLSQALSVKPGEWMKKALDVCMAWQLRNPGSKNIDEAIVEVRERSEELGIPRGS